MDYDMVLPAIAGVSGMFAGIAVLYSKIRPRCLVKVNCWFCNKDSKVEYQFSDGWMCPSCQQYNGFTEDGDYNRDIPAQYCESLNLPSKSNDKAKQTRLALGNGLCQTCNLNQTLKVRALADYTPIHPENYDHEIDEYRKRLEKTYALCRQCEATLHQTLGKQDSWLKPKLISWRLLLSAENKAQIISSAANVLPRIPFYLYLARFFAVLISLSILLSNIHHLQQHSGVQLVSLDFGLKGEIYLTEIHKFLSPLIIAGLTLVLLAIFGAGKDTLLVSDAVTSFIWVGLLALCSSKQLLPSEDYNSLQVLISATAVIFTFWTLIIPRTFNNTRIIKPSINKSMASDTFSNRLDDTECTLDASLSDELKNLTPPPIVDTRDLTSTPVPPKMSPSTVTANIDSDLESLKISTPYKNGQIRPSTPFSPRALFSDKPGYNPKLNDSYCIHRNSLSPPRLGAKNITQSSWVAGGYWGSPVSPREFSPRIRPKRNSIHSSQTLSFPLSRSSSQSSGYISHNSGLPPYNNHGPCLPNSHPGSVCGGDFERGSVFSEPVYKSWVPPLSINPSDSISQCSYSRGRARSDAQSLYSCASIFSDSSMQKPLPSPTSSASCLFQGALGDISDNSNYSLRSRVFDKTQEIRAQNVNPQTTDIKLNPSLSSRSPWFAFFLGMSFAANGFLIALLLSRSDLSVLGFK